MTMPNFTIPEGHKYHGVLRGLYGTELAVPVIPSSHIAEYYMRLKRIIEDEFPQSSLRSFKKVKLHNMKRGLYADLPATLMEVTYLPEDPTMMTTKTMLENMWSTRHPKWGAGGKVRTVWVVGEGENSNTVSFLENLTTLEHMMKLEPNVFIIGRKYTLTGNLHRGEGQRYSGNFKFGETPILPIDNEPL